MALVPIRIDRTSKPPLGTPLRSDGHWSVQGLVGAWAFNEGAGKTAFGRPYGAVNGNILAPDGLRCLADGAAINAFNTGVSFSGVQKFTILTRIRVQSTSDQCCILDDWEGATHSTLIRVNSGDIQFYTQTGSQVGGSTGLSLAVNEWANLVFIYDGSLMSAYKNNVQGTSTYNQSGGFTNLSQVLRIAAYMRNVVFDAGYMLIHNIALTPAQVASLSANPWQIYEPEIVWIEVPDGASGDGSVTLTITNSLHGQTTTTLSLSQIHSVLVNGGVHNHVGGALTLTQDHAISILAALHGHTATSSTLQQNHSLSVAGGAHSHAAVQTTLQQLHSLLIDQAIHASSSDVVAFGSTINLIVQGALHGHQSQLASLQQLHQLSVASAAHSNLASSAVVGFFHDLIISGALHGQTATAAQVDQLHQLIVQAANHEHTALASTLQQIHGVLVNGTSHSHSAESVLFSVLSALSIASSSHTQSAGSITLSQEHQLAIQKAVHAIANEVPGINQNHTLIVSGTLHDQVARLVGIVPGIVQTPDERVILVLADSRIFVISADVREFKVT